MMYWGNHMSAGGWILSVLWTLIIVVLIVAGIVWLVSARSSRGSGPQAQEASAREILDRRLASGELTIEQYRHLRETLDDNASSTPADSQPLRPASASS